MTIMNPSSPVFLPLRHPHQYGFSLPLIFSFLPLECFHTLLSVTNNLTWISSLIDPQIDNWNQCSIHFEDGDSTSDSSFLSSHAIYDFLKLSPLRLQRIQEISLFFDRISEKEAKDEENHKKYVDFHQNTFHRIMDHFRQIHFSFPLSSPSLSPSPLLRSLIIHFYPDYFTSQTVTHFIDKLIAEVISYQDKTLNPKHLGIDIKPFSFIINLHCRTFLVDSSFLSHLTGTKNLCADHHIDLKMNFLLSLANHWKSMSEDNILTVERIHQRYHSGEFHHLHESKHPHELKVGDVSLSPLVNFQSLSSFLRIQKLDFPMHHAVPSEYSSLSSLLPLCCPHLSSIHFFYTYSCNDHNMREMGNIIHTMRESLSTVTFTVHADHPSCLIDFLQCLPALSSHLPLSLYSNITTLDFFFYPYEKWFHSYLRILKMLKDPLHALERFIPSFQSILNKFSPLCFTHQKSDFLHLVWYFLPKQFLSHVESLCIDHYRSDVEMNAWRIHHLPLVISQMVSLKTFQWTCWGGRYQSHCAQSKSFDPVLTALSHCHSLTSLTIPAESKFPERFLSTLSALLHHFPLLTYLNISSFVKSDRWVTSDMKSLSESISRVTHPHFTTFKISQMSEWCGMNHLNTLLNQLPYLRSLSIPCHPQLISTLMLKETSSESPTSSSVLSSLENKLGDSNIIWKRVVLTVGNMIDLRHLELSFTDWEYFHNMITDPNTSIIASLCRHNKNIESIAVVFDTPLLSFCGVIEPLLSVINGILDTLKRENYSEHLLFLREFHIRMHPNLEFLIKDSDSQDGKETENQSKNPSEEEVKEKEKAKGEEENKTQNPISYQCIYHSNLLRSIQRMEYEQCGGRVFRLTINMLKRHVIDHENNSKALASGEIPNTTWRVHEKIR